MSLKKSKKKAQIDLSSHSIKSCKQKGISKNVVEICKDKLGFQPIETFFKLQTFANSIKHRPLFAFVFQKKEKLMLQWWQRRQGFIFPVFL